MHQANIVALPQSVKYAIIGAGIHGLSTAFHLAQMSKKSGRGSAEDILVVDKTAIAAGASGIACGVVRNNYFQPARAHCSLPNKALARREIDRQFSWGNATLPWLGDSPHSRKRMVSKANSGNKMQPDHSM
jgi:glycine/D-amino acid oxidase-like deaminating enzyme